MLNISSLTANLSPISEVQKPGPRPMALAFPNSGQAKGQAWWSVGLGPSLASLQTDPD